MKSVVQLSVDIALTDKERNEDYIKKIDFVLQHAGFDVLGIDFSEDVTEKYDDCFNDYELDIICDIEWAERFCSIDEMELFHDGNNWYLYKYIEGYGAVPVLDDDSNMILLTTDEECSNKGIDIDAIATKLGCYISG